MWSQQNKEYVKELVTTMRSEYPYYLAVTNTNISNSYNTEYPSFYVYFSKDKINANGLYNYSFSDNSVRYTVISGSASNSYHSSRVSISNYSGNLSLNNYEFIYSNAEYNTETVMPDIYATNSISRGMFQGVAFLISFLLITNLVIRLVRT